MPDNESLRVSLLRSRFDSLGSQWDDLRHVIALPPSGFKPEEADSGSERVRTPDEAWRFAPHARYGNYLPFSDHWLIVQGRLVAGGFFDSKLPPRDGDPHSRLQDLILALNEFFRLAGEAASCFQLERRLGQSPCTDEPSDRWIEYLYDEIETTEQCRLAPFVDTWRYKELPTNVFSCSAQVLQLPIAKRSVPPFGNQAGGHSKTFKVDKPPAPAKPRGRKVPKEKILLGQALQFDWLKYRDLGKPDDENDAYNDWRKTYGLSGDFDVSLAKAKVLRNWFAFTHTRAGRHPDDAVSLQKGLTLSHDDKQSISDWLKSCRKEKK